MRRRTVGNWLAAFAVVFTFAANAASADNSALPAEAHNDIYRQDTGRSGYTPDTLATPLSLVWKHTINATKSAAAAVYSKGVIYFGNGQNLYALDGIDGTQKWSFSGDGIFNSSPDIVGGYVYIGTEKSELYKIDATTGKQIWVRKLSGPIHSSPLVVDNVLYIGSDDNFCYALDVATGQSRWSVQANGAVSSPPAYTSDKQVLFASTDNCVRSVDAASGRILWNAKLPSDPSASPPVYSDNSIYVGSSNRLYCLLPRSGNARWKAILPSDITTPCAVGLSTIYFATADNDVLAVDDRGHTLWSVSIDYPTTTAPLLAGKTLIITTTHGMIYALNAETGKRLWQYLVQSVATGTQPKFNFTNINTAPTLADGTLYVFSDDGSLSAFQATATDKIPPQISHMSPAPGSTVGGARIPYGASVQDEGSGINPATIKLLVDGIPVPPIVYDTTINGVRVAAKSTRDLDIVPRLSDGTHQAALTAMDWRGNTVTQNWGFTVDNSFNPPDLSPAPKQPDYTTIEVKPDHTLSPTPPAPATPPHPKSGGAPGAPPPPPI